MRWKTQPQEGSQCGVPRRMDWKDSPGCSSALSRIVVRREEPEKAATDLGVARAEVNEAERHAQSEQPCSR